MKKTMIAAASCRNAGMTMAATEFVRLGSADAESGKLNPAVVSAMKPGTNTSFASPNEIRAVVLDGE